LLERVEVREDVQERGRQRKRLLWIIIIGTALAFFATFIMLSGQLEQLRLEWRDNFYKVDRYWYRGDCWFVREALICRIDLVLNTT